MLPCRKHFIAILFACAVMACSGTAASNERIVSIGGDVTEILYALGLEDRLIAVDSTSSYPAVAKKLPNVGYMRQLSAEPVLALAPDHILAIADAGPESAVNVLKQAGVRYTVIPDEPSVEGTLAKIHAVATAVDEPSAGERLAEGFRRAVDAVRNRVGEPSKRPRTLFLLSVGRGGLMAGGRGTSADAIIRLSGGKNIAADFEGYKPFEPEAMNALDPQVIIVTDRTLAALGGRDAILVQPQFAGTSAAKSGRLVAMDGMLMLGFGPRLPQAITGLAAALHPQGAAE